MSTLPLFERAKEWCRNDCQEADRKLVEHWLAANNSQSLELAFGPDIEFGTAGLRGLMGPGPAQMNQAVIRRTTMALCEAVLANAGSAKKLLVVGYDGRLNSAEFAADVCAVARAKGVAVMRFSEPTPTPLVAFVCKAVGASAAVAVTASHNPPQYNGYKVYWNNGAQITSPIDSSIAQRIALAGPANMIPTDFTEAPGELIPESLIQSYINQVTTTLPTNTSPNNTPSSERQLRIAYTALHGVGERTVRQVFGAQPWADFHSVTEQANPDGAFPTVSFPNPEEPGAMDRVLSLAQTVSADLVIANDPDADRLCVALPRPPTGASPTAYTTLTGNEVGCLLAYNLLSAHKAPHRAAIVSSIVSTPWVHQIASFFGARSESTLTGFKWIASRSIDLRQHSDVLLGFEEALGYSVGDLVHDKDGISAAYQVALIARSQQLAGKTLWDMFAEIAERCGVFVSYTKNLTYQGLDAQKSMAANMTRLRNQKVSDVAGLGIDQQIDLTSDTRPEGPYSLLPKANVIVFELTGGHRIIVRPSGTEPKVKIYVDVRVFEGGPMHVPYLELTQNPKDHPLVQRLTQGMLDLLGV